jgi:hypothetical protein
MDSAVLYGMFCKGLHGSPWYCILVQYQLSTSTGGVTLLKKITVQHTESNLVNKLVRMVDDEFTYGILENITVVITAQPFKGGFLSVEFEISRNFFFYDKSRVRIEIKRSIKELQDANLELVDFQETKKPDPL